MIDERREEQAGLYTLGVLPEAERADFESALRADAALRRLVEELRAAADALPLAAPQLVPPASLKARVFAELDRRTAADKIIPLPGRGPAFWLPWAIAACLAVTCVILWGQGNFLTQQSAGLARQLDEVSHRAGQLRNQADIFESQLALLRGQLVELRQKDQLSQMRIAMLGSLLEKSPKAVAVSVWDQDRQQGVLVVDHLAPLPQDQDYQLWVVDTPSSAVVDAGVFSVDDQGRVRFQFAPKQPVRAASQFAVTVERKGGVPKAEGPMVLAGK